ncbi:15864_t:CDS:2 [Funneliformis geosporum]|nr:15864_t:CDS:2 [Funneliformis geosporum]
MWTLSSGIRPFCNRPHDIKLAAEICFGHRPEIVDGTPNVYNQLMTQCWHSDPLKRPTASQLYELLGSWNDKLLKINYDTAWLTYNQYVVTAYLGNQCSVKK